MAPTVFFQLSKHVRGWSRFYEQSLDVRKIKSTSYRKRLFCFFDREYPYTLSIKYHNITEELKLIPVVSNNGTFSAGLTTQHKDTSLMTVRYKNLDDLQKDIKSIEELKNKINLFDNEQNKKLEDYIKNN